MSAGMISRVTNGFMRVLTFVSGWSLIPVALMVSLLPPFPLWVRLALVVLPTVLFVSWLVKVTLAGNLAPKSSPATFCVALATDFLFLSIMAAYVGIGGVGPIEKGVSHVFRMKRSPGIGVMMDRSRRQQLFRDGIRFDLLRGIQDEGHAAVLDYKIHGYNFSTIRFLFNDIFIDQQYFFDSDVRQPFVIDCGSHIGMSILYAKTLYPDSQVLGFEPAPDTFRLLSENIRQNGLKDVFLVNKAVGNREGKLKFYGDDSLTSSIFASRGDSRKLTEVEVVQLSRYIDRPVTFLKLDVEGAEDLVLDDLARNSKLGLIRQMTVEYHHHIEKNADALSRFLKILEDNNFGYQIQTSSEPYSKKSFQDIMIYAYQK
jgi:FkbM family methyltransferase